MYKAEERSYRVYRVTWDAIRDGAKNYPILEGELGGYTNTITVDLNSFDPDEGVCIDLIDAGRSAMVTLDECVKHGYFSRFYGLKCTIVVTVYRANGSYDRVHYSIRIHFKMTTLQFIRTLKETKEDDNMDEKTRRYIREIRLGALAGRAYLAAIPSTHSGRYPWGSGESRAQTVPGIKKVYFNKPATVIIWEDDTKTIVKCQPGEKYDAEKGLAMAIAKKALGNTGKWYDTFKKELPKPKKRSSAKKGATDETA